MLSKGVFLVALPILLAPFRAGSRASLTCPNGVPNAGLDLGPLDLLTAYVCVASAPKILTYDLSLVLSDPILERMIF